MDAFDPENDLIDKYLRGEMSREELDRFERQLQTNTSLKEDVELRRLLVGSIQAYGSRELKNYLRQRTGHRRLMKISYRNWYYAAAAVGLILIASTVFLISRNPLGKTSESAVASQTDSSSAEMAQHPAKPDSTSPAIAVQTEDVPGKAKDSLTAQNEPGEDGMQEPMPEAVTVASNIPVIPIRIKPAVKEQAGNRGNVSTGRNDNPDEEVMSQGKMDTAIANHTGSMKPAITSGEDDAARFKLSFLATREGEPSVAVTKSGQNGLEMAVYNLPYDNPLIFNYQSRYFLKTGDRYYEINTQAGGLQKVKPVADPALIKLLSR